LRHIVDVAVSVADVLRKCKKRRLVADYTGNYRVGEAEFVEVLAEKLFYDTNLRNISRHMPLEIRERYDTLNALTGGNQRFHNLRCDVHIHRDNAVRNPAVAVGADYNSAVGVVAD